MGIAEANDALIVGEGWNIDAEGISVHLGLLVVGAEHAGDGNAVVDQGGGAINRRAPVAGIGIGDYKVRADPGGGFDQFQIICDHFLEEDYHGDFSGDRGDKFFKVLQSAGHADWTTLSLEVNVP